MMALGWANKPVTKVQDCESAFVSLKPLDILKEDEKIKIKIAQKITNGPDFVAFTLHAHGPQIVNPFWFWRSCGVFSTTSFLPQHPFGLCLCLTISQCTISSGKGSGAMVTVVHIHEWIFIHLPNINIPYMSSKDHVENTYTVTHAHTVCKCCTC